MPDEQPIMVTTEHKGVFCGLYGGDPSDADKEKITISEARMCVYWEKGLRGVLGLASDGPTDDCRVSPAVEQITLYDLTSITPVSPEAYEAWKEEPWS